jgi:hypothetical protein
MSAFIAAKRELFLEELDAVDGKDLMNPNGFVFLNMS